MPFSRPLAFFPFNRQGGDGNVFFPLLGKAQPVCLCPKLEAPREVHFFRQKVAGPQSLVLSLLLVLCSLFGFEEPEGRKQFYLQHVK